MLLCTLSLIGIPITLALVYLSINITHYLKHACWYKKTQYYALYKTPFVHIINNASAYTQYITYQTLLRAFAHNSDLLISHDPTTVLLIHPSGIIIFDCQGNSPVCKTIPIIKVKNTQNLTAYSQKLQSKPAIYHPHKLMQFYDTILTNKKIPYF